MFNVLYDCISRNPVGHICGARPFSTQFPSRLCNDLVSVPLPNISALTETSVFYNAGPSEWSLGFCWLNLCRSERASDQYSTVPVLLQFVRHSPISYFIDYEKNNFHKLNFSIKTICSCVSTFIVFWFANIAHLVRFQSRKM